MLSWSHQYHLLFGPCTQCEHESGRSKTGPNAVSELRQLAKDKAAELKGRRETQPNLTAVSTVAQAKLEAVKNGAQFRKVMGEIGASAGLEITMVQGRINPETGLLEKCEDGDDGDGAGTAYYFISKRGFRMAQKVWVRGNVNTICDINRALMEAPSFGHMLAGAKAFFEHPDVEIVEIKVRSLGPVRQPALRFES